MPVSEDLAMNLKLMSFNLRYENEKDSGKRAWRERVIGIVRLIRSQEVDVLGIQEGKHGQVADLRASLQDYEFYGYGRDDGGKEGEYAGIYYRKDRFEVDSSASGMIWLSDTPGVKGSKTWGNEFPRVATWVRLTDRASGQGLWAINMHLDHRSQISREKGVRLMAKKLVAMNPERDPVVWMGDFNAVENNSVYSFLGGKSSTVDGVDGFKGLKEAYGVLHPGEEKRGTLHFWMSDPDRQWKVDHIFVSKSADIRAAEVLRTGEPYLSDHFPVYAEITFPYTD